MNIETTAHRPPPHINRKSPYQHMYWSTRWTILFFILLALVISSGIAWLVIETYPGGYRDQVNRQQNQCQIVGGCTVVESGSVQDTVQRCSGGKASSCWDQPCFRAYGVYRFRTCENVTCNERFQSTDQFNDLWVYKARDNLSLRIANATALAVAGVLYPIGQNVPCWSVHNTTHVFFDDGTATYDLWAKSRADNLIVLQVAVYLLIVLVIGVALVWTAVVRVRNWWLHRGRMQQFPSAN